MKNYFNRLKSALVKLCKKKPKTISLREWFTLTTTAITIAAIAFFVIERKVTKAQLEDTKAQLQEYKEANINTLDSYEISTRLSESAKKNAINELEKAKKHAEELGKIEIYEGSIMVRHSVKPDEKTNPNAKAVSDKEAPATYRSLVAYQDIEWDIAEDNKSLIAYIDHATIDRKNVRRDNRVEPIIHRHPSILLTEEYKDKNELIQGWKKYVDNDYKDFGMTDEEITLLDMKWDSTFEDAAYAKIEQDLLSKPAFTKNLDDLAIASVSNVYNAKAKFKVKKEDGTEKTSELDLGLPVKVMFKDQKA